MEARAAVVLPGTTNFLADASSADVADKKAAASQAAANFQKAINDNAPIVAEKLKTEVAPALASFSKSALVEAEKAAPVIQQTATELAPVAQQAAEVLKPVLIKGATTAGTALFEFSKTAGTALAKGAVEAGTVIVNEASTQINAQVAPKLSTVVDENTKKTIEDGGKVFYATAAPLVDEGVKQATPLLESAFKSASKYGGAALRKGLANAESALDAYLAAEDAPAASAASSSTSSLANAQAERDALMAKINALKSD